MALAADREIDVFVELIGGDGDPAKRAVETALATGKSVVTANKALLAKHGAALAALAEKHHVALNFEAAVGGAIPIVKTLREGMVGNSFSRVSGILNGTCNYILTRMEQEKLSFAECLKDAQRLGYAEADPSFDVDGLDTAQKLAMLASLAFGIRANPEAVFVEGISSITPEDLDAADELGYRVKLLGVALRTEQGIEQRVHPTMVPKDTAIAQVMGVTNALVDRRRRHCADHAGRARRRRRGDRLGGCRRPRRHRPRACALRRSAGLPACSPTAARRPMQRHEGGYYIRLLARRPARHLCGHREAPCGREDLARIDRAAPSRRPAARWRRSGEPGEPAPVILITYATTEDAVRRALNAIKNQGVIAGQPQVIRIEKN